MSKVFKSIGKIFKKVVKTVVKIAPFALAAAAVVFTGGAALGILPSFSAAVGGVVSSLGLSAGVTGALTGAITSAGFGAALGFVTGGKQGLQKGALMGALTGGVLGMVNPSTFGIVSGANGTTTMNALAHGGNAFGSGAATSTALKGANGLYSSVPKVGGIGPVNGNIPFTSLDTNPQPLAQMQGGLTADQVGNIGSSATGVGAAPATGIAPLSTSQPVPFSSLNPAAPLQTVPGGFDPSQFMSTSGPSAAAVQGIGTIQSTTGGVGGIPASGGSGVLDFLNKNPSLVGNVLQALGTSNSKVSAKDLQKEVDAQIQLKQRADALAYGGVYSGNPSLLGGNQQYMVPTPRYYYDPSSQTVVDRQATGGA